MEAFENRARRINEALNAFDLNPIGDFYADDAVLAWPGLAPVHGRQAIVRFYAQLLGALPELQRTIRHVITGDAIFAVEWESNAAIAGVSYGEVDADGRIRSQREYFDRGGTPADWR